MEINKIIFIGNGFDIAHGLKTGYGDFIKHLWEEEIINLQNDIKKFDQIESDTTTLFTYKSPLFKLTAEKETQANPYDSFTEMLHEISGIQLNFQNLKKYSITNDNEKIDLDLFQSKITTHHSFSFQNSFFERINTNNKTQGWVDFEQEFFEALKKTNDVEKLNTEFEQIKDLFENYLIKNVKPKVKDLKINEHIKSLIYKDFEIKDFSINYKSKLNLDDVENIKISKEIENDNHNFPAHEILFLNFNYTNTADIYSIYGTENDFYTNVIGIHGELENPENPIIFGYGDERSEDYKELELKNQNEYFEHIKSFAYLNTKNYRRLLDYISSNKYQIIILGHSCGLTDRTLLNTLFEHENCISIKPYYFEDENKDKNKDNYQPIVRNISRNFDDKVKMRELVVNKEFCEAFSIKNKEKTESEVIK